jgi:hypothetical protein
MRIYVYEDGSTAILGLAESEKVRLGDTKFSEIEQALFELEEDYSSWDSGFECGYKEGSKSYDS